jgi:hypothetical protein
MEILIAFGAQGDVIASGRDPGKFKAEMGFKFKELVRVLAHDLYV